MQTARSTDAGRHTAARCLAFTALPYFAAFAIPFCVLCVAFAQLGIYPFGDVSVMVHDMPVQYADYFGWLIQVMHGEGNLLYSNAAGLGGGMFSLFTYYLSSPFNLLAWFFTPETVPQLLSWLTLLKIPTCALACLGFLRGRFLAPEARSWSEARAQAAAAPAASHVTLVLLACAYALTSYVLGYASNIMWLDGVIMAPCALLGTWRLMQRRAYAGLFAATAGSIWFNWYTGYMVCLLCVLYFFFELARRPELRGHRLRSCCHFGVTMALAVGAGIAVLLPTALSLLGGKGAGAGLSSLITSDALARNPILVPDLFCIGTTPGITTQANRPAIVISAFALAGAGVFFANRAISGRSRIAGGILLAVMLSSLVLVPVATIWSGFVPESSYLNRNGFAILLVIVMLAAEGLLALRRLPRKQAALRAFVGCATVLACFVISVLSLLAVKHELLQSQTVGLAVLECALLACFTALIVLLARNAGEHAHEKTPTSKQNAPAMRAGRKAATASLCTLLAVLFVCEQAFDARIQLEKCVYTTDGFTQNLTELETFYNTFSTGDAGFARVGNSTSYWGNGHASSKANGPDNMALMLAYSTFDHYSSTQETRIQELLRNLGYSKVTPFGTYYMSPNTAADALLGVTTIVAESQPPATQADGAATLRDRWHAWSNDLALPLGWGTTGSAQVSWGDDPFANQAAMLADAAGLAENNVGDLFSTPVVSETGDNVVNGAAVDAAAGRQFTVTAQSDGPLLLFFPTLYQDDIYYEGGIACTLYVNGAEAQVVGRRGSCNIVNVGTVSAGQTVTVQLTPASTTQKAGHSNGHDTTVDEALYEPSAEEVVQARVLDMDCLRSQLARIDSDGFALTAYENGHIAATFDAAQDETLVISQPYEDGWSATVNGQPAQLEPAYDGLMGIPVQAGENTVELHYMTPGLIPGAVVSIASVTLFGVWRAVARRRSMQKGKTPQVRSSTKDEHEN